MNLVNTPDELAQARAVRAFVDRTRRAIKAGRLLCGAELDAEVHAEHLDVPLVRLRSHLAQLEAEGLLTTVNGSLLMVSPLDHSQLDSAFRLRLLLEPHLLATSVRARPSRHGPRSGPDREPHAASGDGSVLDWQDDHLFEQTCNTYLDFVRPVASSVEMQVCTELIADTERAVRVGFGVVSKDYPGDLDRLAAHDAESVYSCSYGSPADARRCCIAFLNTIQEMVWLGVRSNPSLSA